MFFRLQAEIFVIVFNFVVVAVEAMDADGARKAAVKMPEVLTTKNNRWTILPLIEVMVVDV